MTVEKKIIKKMAMGSVQKKIFLGAVYNNVAGTILKHSQMKDVIELFRNTSKAYMEINKAHSEGLMANADFYIKMGKMLSEDGVFIIKGF